MLVSPVCCLGNDLLTSLQQKLICMTARWTCVACLRLQPTNRNQPLIVSCTCRGTNESGQLGDGSKTTRTSPVLVTTDHLFVDLAAGAQHTCGLLNNGNYACWGG